MPGVLLALALSVGGCGRSAAKTQARPNVTVLAPANGPLASQLAAEAKKAKDAGKRPYAEISATWCHSCRDLHAGMSDPRMVDAFTGTHIVELDVDAWGSALPQAGLGATSVPAFFELGDDGQPTGRQLGGDAWSKDVPASMAPPLKKFFQGT